MSDTTTKIEELVSATIKAGEENPKSWLITRFGTVLVHRPDVVMYIGMGKMFFKFGIGMPPVYNASDIADIPLTHGQRNRLWDALSRVKAAQLQSRTEKALATVGL